MWVPGCVPMGGEACMGENKCVGGTCVHVSVNMSVNISQLQKKCVWQQLGALVHTPVYRHSPEGIRHVCIGTLMWMRLRWLNTHVCVLFFVYTQHTGVEVWVQVCYSKLPCLLLPDLLVHLNHFFCIKSDPLLPRTVKHRHQATGSEVRLPGLKRSLLTVALWARLSVPHFSHL